VKPLSKLDFVNKVLVMFYATCALHEKTDNKKCGKIEENNSTATEITHSKFKKNIH
jgi:hypothetical protein